MQDGNDTAKIILASKSPRRANLLKKAGLSFSIVPSGFNENSLTMSSFEIHAKALAEAKANNVAADYPDSWIIGADTIVISEGIMLGKPASAKEAHGMLKCLSGKKHFVLTGYCICCKAKKRYFSETITTEVFFRDLTHEEIQSYIRTKEPFDKAGGYAIQGLGVRFVKKIKGSFTNVVGLPVREVISALINEGALNYTPKGHKLDLVNNHEHQYKFPHK